MVDASGQPEKPHWRTLFPPTGRPGTPPVAIVFAGAGRTALATRINRVLNLIAEHWQHSFETYSFLMGNVPLLVAALEDLTAYGHQGPAWYRAGGHMPLRGLLEALDDTRG
jgi:hypothetical protein